MVAEGQKALEEDEALNKEYQKSTRIEREISSGFASRIAYAALKREAWTATEHQAGMVVGFSRDDSGDTRVRGRDYDRRSRDHDRAGNVIGNPSVPGITILGVAEDRDLHGGVVL